MSIFFGGKGISGYFFLIFPQMAIFMTRCFFWVGLGGPITPVDRSGLWRPALAARLPLVGENPYSRGFWAFVGSRESLQDFWKYVGENKEK